MTEVLKVEVTVGSSEADGVGLAFGDNVGFGVTEGFGVALEVALVEVTGVGLAFGDKFVCLGVTEDVAVGATEGFGVALAVALIDDSGVDLMAILLHTSFPEEFLLHTTRLIPSVLVALILLHALPVFTAIAEAGKVT